MFKKWKEKVGYCLFFLGKVYLIWFFCIKIVVFSIYVFVDSFYNEVENLFKNWFKLCIMIRLYGGVEGLDEKIN